MRCLSPRLHHRRPGMSAPNPQANAAAAQPDAQPAIYETDIWDPPAADGLLHHLHKPMPAPEPLPELDSEVVRILASRAGSGPGAGSRPRSRSGRLVRLVRSGDARSGPGPGARGRAVSTATGPVLTHECPAPVCTERIDAGHAHVPAALARGAETAPSGRVDRLAPRRRCREPGPSGRHAGSDRGGEP